MYKCIEHVTHICMFNIGAQLTCWLCLHPNTENQNLDSCVWKFKLEAFNSQKHRATTGNGNQDRKKNKLKQVVSCLACTLRKTLAILLAF